MRNVSACFLECFLVALLYAELHEVAVFLFLELFLEEGELYVFAREQLLLAAQQVLYHRAVRVLFLGLR